MTAGLMLASFALGGLGGYSPAKGRDGLFSICCGVFVFLLTAFGGL